MDKKLPPPLPLLGYFADNEEYANEIMEDVRFHSDFLELIGDQVILKAMKDGPETVGSFSDDERLRAYKLLSGLSEAVDDKSTSYSLGRFAEAIVGDAENTPESNEK